MAEWDDAIDEQIDRLFDGVQPATGDPRLTLAAALHGALQPERPSPEFRDRLKADLLERYSDNIRPFPIATQPPIVLPAPQPMARGQRMRQAIVAVAAAAAAAVALLAGYNGMRDHGSQPGSNVALVRESTATPAPRPPVMHNPQGSNPDNLPGASRRDLAPPHPTPEGGTLALTTGATAATNLNPVSPARATLAPRPHRSNPGPSAQATQVPATATGIAIPTAMVPTAAAPQVAMADTDTATPTTVPADTATQLPPTATPAPRPSATPRPSLIDSHGATSTRTAPTATTAPRATATPVPATATPIPPSTTPKPTSVPTQPYATTAIIRQAAPSATSRPDATATLRPTATHIAPPTASPTAYQPRTTPLPTDTAVPPTIGAASATVQPQASLVAQQVPPTASPAGTPGSAAAGSSSGSATATPTATIARALFPLPRAANAGAGSPLAHATPLGVGLALHIPSESAPTDSLPVLTPVPHTVELHGLLADGFHLQPLQKNAGPANFESLSTTVAIGQRRYRATLQAQSFGYRLTLKSPATASGAQSGSFNAAGAARTFLQDHALDANLNLQQPGVAQVGITTVVSFTTSIDGRYPIAGAGAALTYGADGTLIAADIHYVDESAASVYEPLPLSSLLDEIAHGHGWFTSQSGSRPDAAAAIIGTDIVYVPVIDGNAGYLEPLYRISGVNGGGNPFTVYVAALDPAYLR